MVVLEVPALVVVVAAVPGKVVTQMVLKMAAMVLLQPYLAALPITLVVGVVDQNPELAAVQAALVAAVMEQMLLIT